MAESGDASEEVAVNRPIVVGVDGSAPALLAVHWAAQEAALRRAPLRILHAAVRWAYAVPLIPQPPQWGPEAQAVTERLLEEAVAHAREAAPGVEVSADVIDGAAQDVLATAAEDAQLAVVGSRGRGGFSGLLLGSVGRRLSEHSPCPAVIVRGPEGGSGEIAVGIAGSGGHDEDAVLEFAFHEAALRGARLRAVHAWRHPTARAPGDMQPLVYDVDEVAGEEARLLAEVLAGWRTKFPDVVLVEDVVHEHPGTTMVQASAGADLVVVGASRGLGAVLGLGSTAHAVVHHAHGPVVVVPHPRRL